MTTVASSVSGMLARIPMHPVDTVKAKLQVQTRGGYRGLMSVVQTTVRQGGAMALYAGFGTAFWGSAPAACLYWTSYEASKKLFFQSQAARDRPMLTHFCSGFAAEIVSCVLWVPIDVVKERLQVQSDLKTDYRGNLGAIRAIYAREGLAGIYKGYHATVLSFGPFTAINLMLNEEFKARAKVFLGAESDADVPFAVFTACGATAGAVSSLITNPLDKAKLRLQVQRAQAAVGGAMGAGGGGSSFFYTGFGNALVSIWRDEGLRGLFRGAGARVLFAAPSTALSIGIFEWLRARLL